jgi:hypothetical protein
MKLRVDFIGGSWKVIECDDWKVDGQLTRFTNEDKIVLTVLTAVTRNMTYFEPARDLPETSRDVRPGDVFHDEGKVGQRAEKNSERFVGKLYNRHKPPSKSRTSFDQTTYEASSLRTPI